MVQAKLFVLKQEIELLWTDVSYVRQLRPNGKPASEVLGGLITVRFATTPETDQVLRWMTKKSEDETFREADKMEEGKICFYKDGFGAPPTKTYLFNDAFPVHYKEVFLSSGDEPMQTIMTISPAIQDYGTKFVKRWNLSHIAPTDETFVPSEVFVEEKKITDIYFEDMEGYRVRKLPVGSEVYLVIESENITGRKVNVNLGDKNNDFIHNGDLLEDDILRDLVISGDVHKEKLKIVAEHLAEETPVNPNTSNQSTANTGEKKLVEYFMTDTSGKRVDKFEVGDTVILNIKTENRIGDKITIHLDDKTHDFRYQGEVLPDDKLSDYTIQKDLEKIELEVIAQSPVK